MEPDSEEEDEEEDTNQVLRLAAEQIEAVARQELEVADTLVQASPQYHGLLQPPSTWQQLDQQLGTFVKPMEGMNIDQDAAKEKQEQLAKRMADEGAPPWMLTFQSAQLEAQEKTNS